MPVKNGRIYIDKSKTPNVGISSHDIARCLGVGTLDIGKLCTHDKVNMFSRKKSVEIPTQEPNRATDWWKGTEGNCGIAAPARVTSFSALLAQYDGGMNGWRRVKPVTWFRYNDFDGYYHYAQPPIKDVDSMEAYFKHSDTPVNVSVTFNEYDIDENGSGSLRMSDIIIDNRPLNDWYLGVVIFDEDGSNIIGFNASQKGAENDTLAYPTTGLQVGKSYLLVPFYSTEALDEKLGDGDKTIMALPIIQPVKFLVKEISDLLTITADVEIARDLSSLTLKIEIKNNGVTFRNVSIGTARIMAVREGLESEDDYWMADTDATKDYEEELLKNVDIQVEGLTLSKTISLRDNFKDYVYVVLVRLISKDVNFDYGPEYILPEGSPS